MNEIKFRRDTSFRKQFFVPDSFSHPAKMDAQLLIWIVEKYTEAGETILDPMAGSGTTMLACGLGRNVILVELEEKFCKMMRDNWEEVRMRPQLGYSMGECQIIQGDARQLEGLVDKIVTSPPYAEQSDFRPEGGLRDTSLYHGGGVLPQKFGGRDNIGNLPYGEIDKCIFSPPYADEPTISESYLRIRSAIGRDITKPSQRYRKYDSIITSPPYEGQKTGEIDADRWATYMEKRDIELDRNWGKDRHTAGRMRGIESMGSGYSGDRNNIGNLKSASYLEAMLQVYRSCFAVLKAGGLLILVTKNFIRNKQVVKLDEDTIKLCEQAGFSYLERYYRKLPSQSFWRVIYHQKHPEVEQILYEDVLVFTR